MDGRGLTNILLAIIAGVLLFGREAMTSGIQGLAFVAVIVFVIWLVLILIGRILSWVGSEWHSAKSTEDRLSVVFATLAGLILTPLAAYTLWLWMSGAENPLREAAFSPLGYAWMGLLIVLVVGLSIIGSIRWLANNRGHVHRIVWYRLRLIFWGYLEFLGGPFTFPVRDWRMRTESGSGTAVKIASAAYVTVIGLIVSLMTAMLTALAGYGLLSSFGLVD